MSDYVKRFSVEGKRVLVTGASRGIGAEIAAVLAEAGADIAITGRDAAGLAATGGDADGGLDDELRAMLASVGTTTLSAQLRQRGFDAVSIDGVRASRPGSRMVGLARTLRFVPFRPDLAETHGTGFTAQKRAFDTLEAGEVLVIEARGETGTGTVGDILALRAQTRGAAGIVTDGGIRDFAQVAALGIPSFSAGPHPAVLGRRHVVHRQHDAGNELHAEQEQQDAASDEPPADPRRQRLVQQTGASGAEPGA